MEAFSVTPQFNLATLFLALLLIIIRPVNCQISRKCTVSMVQSFTPCMNYVTGSSSSGNSGISPTADCCASLKSLMVNGIDCLCLIVNGGGGGFPFSIPFNTTLVAQLPVACNTSPVPIECKGSDLQSPSNQPWTDAPAATPVPGPRPGLVGGDGPISTPHQAMTPEADVLFPMTPLGVGKPDLSFVLSSNSLSRYHYFLVIAVSMLAFAFMCS